MSEGQITALREIAKAKRMPVEDRLTIWQISFLSNLSERTVRRDIKSGKLEAQMVAGTWMVSIEAAAAYVVLGKR